MSIFYREIIFFDKEGFYVNICFVVATVLQNSTNLEIVYVDMGALDIFLIYLFKKSMKLKYLRNMG